MMLSVLVFVPVWLVVFSSFFLILWFSKAPFWWMHQVMFHCGFTYPPAKVALPIWNFLLGNHIDDSSDAFHQAVTQSLILLSFQNCINLISEPLKYRMLE